MHLSFVFPCLNEERTLAHCIRNVRLSLEADSSINYEIVVADNGSNDASCTIAEQEGARIVHVSRKGYGAALLGGIAAANGEYVIFADADATYCYEHTIDLYRAARNAKADMAIASRMSGAIDTGAMPLLHRYLGTPVLTALINRLFGGHLTDCNSGFRCVRKHAFEQWQIRSTGMEFASELLIKALKHRAVLVEIPSGLHADQAGRIPHLKTWRDGMRHLLFILSEKPQLFEFLGLLGASLSLILQTAAVFLGQIEIGRATIFGLHTQILLLLLGIMGTQTFHFGAMCYVNSSERPKGIAASIIQMDEGRLFFLLLILMLLVMVLVGGAFAIWSFADFHNIYFANVLVGLVHLIAMLVSLAMGMLGVHVIKRYR